MSDTNQISLDQKQVDQLARLLNITYNSAFLYGSTHPTTKKNIVPFFTTIRQCLQMQSMISFIISQDAMYVEDLPVDKKIGMNKIIQHFGKAGIASITFDTMVRPEEIEFFVKLSGDLNQLTSADAITAKMTEANIQGVRLNYVRYGKITRDEKVVSSSVVAHSEPAVVAKSVSLSDAALSQIEQVLSLSTLLEKPEKTASLLSEAVQNDTAAAKALDFIGKLRTDVNQADPQSIELLLDAIYELKLDLSEAIEVQKVTGKIMSRPDLIKGKMTELTCDTILKLVKEEYASGKLPVKRLSHIILRMLPDYSELKQILPRLKELLLSEGMSVKEYLELIKMLDLEIQSDELSGSLDEAAKGIGVTVSELVDAIKREPQDTAKLIFLAAEIRQGTYEDDEQLSGVLSEYIEKISSNIALQSKELGGSQGSKALKKIIVDLESQFLQKLKNYGVEMPVLMKVKEQLSGRLNTVFETAVTDWMKVTFDSSLNGNTGDIGEKIKNFMGADASVQKYQDTLTKQLLSRGYQTEQIDKFFKNITQQIASGSRLHLPSEALAPKNMLFLLNREIKQHLRYKTPFCTLLIGLKKVVNGDGEAVQPSTAILEQLFSELFTIVRSMLRDIDLIGTVANSEPPALFVLLSMTEPNGAAVVKERICTVVDNKPFLIQNTPVKIEIIVTITAPCPEIIRDVKVFLSAAYRDHYKALSTPLRS